MPERQEGRAGPVIEHQFGLLEDDIVTKILQFIPDRESNKSNLAYADIAFDGSSPNVRIVLIRCVMNIRLYRGTAMLASLATKSFITLSF